MNKNHPLQAVIDEILLALTQASPSNQEVTKNVCNVNDAIESSIFDEYYFSGLEGVAGTGKKQISPEVAERLKAITYCQLVMCNGYVVTGKSAVMNMAQYDRKLGEKYAREDAIRNAAPILAFTIMDLKADDTPDHSEDQIIEELIRG